MFYSVLMLRQRLPLNRNPQNKLKRESFDLLPLRAKAFLTKSVRESFVVRLQQPRQDSEFK